MAQSLPTIIRIATRASRLALWQSEHVAALLKSHHRDLVVELVPLSTVGDRILDKPLAKIGGKGLFIKELEVAMLDGRADIAVHSMKDVPAEIPPEFEMPVILARENPDDVLVSMAGLALSDLPPGSHVGTSSLRRRSQLLARRPDLVISDLRGNVPTRLQRLDEGAFDAIVLAAAGLKRLGLLDARCHALSHDEVLPAVGQGAIGIETRRGDRAIGALLAPLHCPQSDATVGAERAMNSTLGGSCEVPIAGHAQLHGDAIEIRALVASHDGQEIIRREAVGPRGQAKQIGRPLGETLLAAGAGRILALSAPD